MSKVVITDSYHHAANALEKHGFVLLVGEPAAGKTTIATMLSISAIDRWGTDTIKVATAEKVKEHWNAENPPRLFWIDDAFGVMQYESTLVQGWNHILLDIRAMLTQGVKIIMTSRDYIYRRARNDLKEGAFPLFQESQVVINVHDLSLEEKQQILYNHLKLGKQPKDFLKAIKPWLHFISENPRFIPETARRLGEPSFTKNLKIYEHEINRFVESQEGFLIEIFKGMDADSQAAFAIIYMNNDALESPVRFKDLAISAIERLGSTTAGCLRALEAMKDTFVQQPVTDDTYVWKYKHPTIGDAFAKYIIGSNELLEIYIHGTTLTKMMGQITLGNVGLENAIIIPKSFYPILVERIVQFTLEKSYNDSSQGYWFDERRLYTFLGRRVGKTFIHQTISRLPAILEDVINPGLYLSAKSAHVDLAIKLNEFGLLTKEARQKFVKKVAGYAIDGEDLSVLEDKKFESIFTKQELLETKEKIRKDLIPRLREVQSSWESSYDDTGDELPSDYMDHFIGVLKTLKKEFEGDREIEETIEEHLGDVEYWIDKNSPDFTSFLNQQDDSSKRLTTKIGPAITQSRSIFDDIDL